MSNIEWTESTWNPLTGCTKVSPGCANCYAERMSHRLRAMGVAKYANAVDDRGRWTGVMTLDEAALYLPLRWRKPRLVFVNSMSDLFHEEVPGEWFEAVWDIMEHCPEHTFQILTKRPERMLELRRRNDERRFERGDYSCEPLPNVWLGVSAEDQQRADERIPVLLATPAAVRFVSCEPLLGPIDLDAGGGVGLDWVIVGGESGPGARPMDLDWARSIRDQCQAAGVPFWLKQLGGHPDKRGGDRALLDGRLWREMPGE